MHLFNSPPLNGFLFSPFLFFLKSPGHVSCNLGVADGTPHGGGSRVSLPRGPQHVAGASGGGVMLRFDWGTGCPRSEGRRALCLCPWGQQLLVTDAPIRCHDCSGGTASATADPAAPPAPWGEPEAGGDPALALGGPSVPPSFRGRTARFREPPTGLDSRPTPPTPERSWDSLRSGSHGLFCTHLPRSGRQGATARVRGDCPSDLP